jgi:DNA-directed RNA polymerase subunit RPC12/RpoP
VAGAPIQVMGMSRMTVIDLFRKYWFVKVILSLWLVSSILILLLLNRIDSIVNVTLYQYGLQSSTNWLDPYWISLRLIYVFLAVPIVFSAVVLIAGFGKTDDGANRVNKRVNGKLSNNQAQIMRENSMLIRCIRCGKVFNKPLTMLDFSNGKPRLANVCPYCNHVLGSADDKASNERIKAEFEKEVPTE